MVIAVPQWLTTRSKHFKQVSHQQNHLRRIKRPSMLHFACTQCINDFVLDNSQTLNVWHADCNNQERRSWSCYSCCTWFRWLIMNKQKLFLRKNENANCCDIFWTMMHVSFWSLSFSSKETWTVKPVFTTVKILTHPMSNHPQTHKVKRSTRDETTHDVLFTSKSIMCSVQSHLFLRTHVWSASQHVKTWKQQSQWHANSLTKVCKFADLLTFV